jgi:hypothetical protein
MLRSIEKEIKIREELPSLTDVSRFIFADSNPNRVALNDYRESLSRAGRLTPAVTESLEKAEFIRTGNQVVVYIAGALTGVDEVTKVRYGQVSDMLSRYNSVTKGKNLFFGYVPHLHGTDPVKHPYVTADEVRDIDNLWATVVADCHINFLSPTAHGNAIEEGWAEKKMIPSIYVNPEGNKLSRLTEGMNNVGNNVSYREFSSDGMEQLKLIFDEFSAWVKYFPDKDPREFFFLSSKVVIKPLLRTYGLDPEGFNPVFPVDQTLIYIKDPKSPRYGQVGQLTGHDWKEYGNLFIDFSDTSEIMSESYRGLSYWYK